MKERKISFSIRVHAVLKNYSLEFNKIASANPQEGEGNIVDADDLVEGVLYNDITKSGRIRLDRFEEYPKEYDRIDFKRLEICCDTA